MELDESVIIVTGSATGVGAAVARRAASKGARVVVNYTKSEAEANETVQACLDLGSDALLCRSDVSVDQDCRRMAAAALKKWGRIDGLVNNAGQSVFASSTDLESLSAEEFLSIYSVNVVGAYQMIRAVTPQFRAQGTGAVVNVSSISAITGGGSSIAYAASKGALNTMTLGLARSLAPEIRVNAVCPGPMPTRWWDSGLGEEGAKALFKKFEEQVPLATAPTADSVAGTVLWLLEGADNITGETIKIDSGQHLIGFKP